MRNQTRIRTRETGSAFVISILVMFILTVLGMALMLTTSTEADIATNYRWGEMAFFNADAALEYSKNVLARHMELNRSFDKALPAARTADQMKAVPGLGPAQTAASRDFQYEIQQGGVTVYIGKVLFDVDRTKHLQFDYRNPASGLKGGELFSDGVEDIQGTATIWVRRPVVGPTLDDLRLYPTDLRPRDDKNNNRVIITAEGTAPNFESSATGRPGATRRLEMSLRVVPAGELDYSHSQAGGSGGSDTQAGTRAASSSASRNATPAGPVN